MQKVSCHEGKCWEEKGGLASFNDLFETSNIVDKIERDLWKDRFYGS